MTVNYDYDGAYPCSEKSFYTEGWGGVGGQFCWVGGRGRITCAAADCRLTSC